MVTPFLKRFSLSRPLTSYRKVRQVVGAIKRRTATVGRQPEHVYLQVGCGPNIKSGFVNLDYEWLPGVYCWDLNRGLPFPDQSFKGIYSEHCLEHLSLESSKRLLHEFHRVLRPEGTARIVVPDVELYINLYLKARQGIPVSMPYEEDLTPLHGLNRIMREHGHQYGYDFEALKAILTGCGFICQQAAFNKGRDSYLLIDTPERECESLYIEAIPASFCGSD